MRDIVEDSTITIDFTTRNTTPVPASVSSGTVTVLKSGGTTTSTAGVTFTADIGSVTGMNRVVIDTSANAFYSTGSEYTVYFSAGTVGGNSVVGEIIAQFSIEKDSYNLTTTSLGDYSAVATTDLPTNFGDLTITASTGLVSVGTNNDKTGYSISGTKNTLDDLNDVSTAQVNAEVDTALGDYDGPTKTEMDAAFTEIKGATWSSSTDTLEAIRNRGDAAWTTATSSTVVTALGLYGAALESTLSDVYAFTDATLTAVNGLNDISASDVLTQATSALNTYDPPTKTEMDSAFTEIKGATWSTTDTLEEIRDNLGAGGGGDATEAKQDTIIAALAVVDGIVDSILEDTGTTLPGTLSTILADTNELQTNQGNWLTATGFSTHSAADVRTEMDSNSTQLAAIVADTNELQTNQGDWATADVSGLATAAALATVDSNVDAILVDTGTSIPATLTAILADTDELQTNQGNWITADVSGLATSAALATVDANVDAILVDTGTTIPGTITTLDTNLDAVKAITDQINFGVAGQIDANVESINTAAVNGSGTSGDKWRGS